MAYELYKTLKLRSDATAEEIRRAYFQLVREFPPEKHPERFQQIRRAYETLSDEITRRDYDALEEHGDEINGLFSQAVHLMEQERWESAAARLKHVLVLAPGNQTALNSLGVCFLHADKYRKANEVYRDLARDHSDVALYQFNLGVSFFEMAEVHREGESGNISDEALEAMYSEARIHFVKAVELQPHNPDHYIAVARTFVEQGEFQQGLEWAERGARARGETDYHDFEALFWICLFQLRMGDLDAVEAAAERIEALLPDDEDVRRYAAFRFVKIGVDLYEHKAIEPAVMFFELACRFDPEDANLQQMYEGSSNTLEICRACDRLMEDDDLISPLKRLAAVCMALFFEEKIDDFEAVMDEIFNELETFPIEAMLDSLQRLRNDYRQVYDVNPTMFGNMERIAEQQTGAEPFASDEQIPPTHTPKIVETLTPQFGSLSRALSRVLRWLAELASK